MGREGIFEETFAVKERPERMRARAGLKVAGCQNKKHSDLLWRDIYLKGLL